jgi:Zn-dependent protease with chaperone function
MGRNGTDMVASRTSLLPLLLIRSRVRLTHPIADLMIRSLLSIFSLALAVLGGLAGYVSSVYWLSAPSAFPSEDAKEVTMLTPLLVAFVCGIVPFWTVRFSSDLLSNA